MHSTEIRALTGLRIVAALWVVLFHFRPLLAGAAPHRTEVLAPVLDTGAQGVDLFFILSGFVLTWNYLNRMGPAWSPRTTLRFLWLRLARVWPVYLVTLHLAAAWIIFTQHVGATPSPDAANLTAVSYLRQLLLVQLWFQPFFDESSWNGPAWSISAEWLAYLLFGLIILAVFRVARVTRAPGLLGLAFAASLPPVLLLLVTGEFYTPWSWLPRVVAQFVAGALACAAVRKLQPSPRARTAAGLASVLLVVTMVAALYWLDAHPLAGLPDARGLVDILFVPLVVTLAIGAGSLPRLLSTRPLVYGGQISFSLYLVHELLHNVWDWVAAEYHLAPSAAGWKVVLIGVLTGCLATAALLYHCVEEPARRWMRRMVDVRDVSAAGRTPAGVPASQPASVPADLPASVPARAGAAALTRPAPQPTLVGAAR